MSYDYDALVSEIAESRRLAREAEAALTEMGNGNGNGNDEDETAKATKELELMEHLSGSVDKFEVLSKHCPMTPLLWMQYALDTYELMKVIKRQEDPQIFSRPKGYLALREVLEIRIQLLELGLHEFPGSAILRLHHAELSFASGRMQSPSSSSSSNNNSNSSSNSTFAEDQAMVWGKYQTLLDTALEALGRGSHRNESQLVVELYKLRCDHAQCQTDQAAIAKDLSRLFLQRAETPMNDGINAGLGEQYASYCGKWASANTLSQIESRRRFEAKHYGFLVTYEDDIDVALKNESGVSNQEGIDRWVAAAAAEEALDQPNSDFYHILSKWKRILDNDTSGCWMGLGGPQTASAFVQYAQACFRYRARKAYDDETDEGELQRNQALEKTIQSLAISVFERGVAECPTVDALWLSYLRRLNYLIDQTTGDGQEHEKRALLTKALGVVDRAIRNCPYSMELVKAKLKVVLTMANAKMTILDPEELLTNFIVKESLDNGFIQPEGDANNPSVAIELFQSLLSAVRNRILFVLAETAHTEATSKNGKVTVKTILKYDDPESIQPLLSNQPTALNQKDMGEDAMQELEDLCNDLREIYDEADSYLRKNHKKYSSDSNSTTITVEEGRATLAKDRATTESHLVAPLLHAIQVHNNNQTDDIAEQSQSGARERLAEAMQQHDKATKIWQPPHPGLYMSYIRELSASSSVVSLMISSPIDVLANLRMVRFLYQKALKSVGNPKKKKNHSASTETDSSVPNSTAVALCPDELDYETSLRCLCRDYLLFEKHFGSDRSYSECQKSVQKKLAKAYALATNASTAMPTPTEPIGDTNDKAQVAVPMALEDGNDNTTISETSPQKRKREDDNAPIAKSETKDSEQSLPPPRKRAREEAPGEPKEAPPRKPTNFQEIQELKGFKQYPKHKVKVGKLEYPAHPFTVKISFLSPQTEDMDLVDALRPKCGPIVHAKIMRDKHTHRSKGWALVQFEERESVETALGLSDVLGIKAKSVIIERSHLPAIGLVPSGMHRVNPKGEGRSTKRNQHLRNKKRNNETEGGQKHKPNIPNSTDKDTNTKDSESKPSTSKPSASKSSIFAFRPRGVSKGGGGAQQRKAKISFSSSDEAKK